MTRTPGKGPRQGKWVQSPAKPLQPSEVVLWNCLCSISLMRRCKCISDQNICLCAPRSIARRMSSVNAYMQDGEAPDPELASKLAALRWSKASARQQQEVAAACGPCATAEAAQQAAEASAAEPSKQQSTVQSQLESQCQMAELEAHALREQLKDAQAKLATEQARAGQRAQETNAALRQHIAALEEERAKVKEAAHNELVACRDAGMKVSLFIPVLAMVHVDLPESLCGC